MLENFNEKKFKVEVNINGKNISLDKSGLSKRQWNELMDSFDLKDKMI